MTYNLEQVYLFVTKRRRKFILYLCLLSLLLIASACAAVINIGITLTFFFVVAAVIFAVLIFILFKKFSPLILFSKELCGINVMEHEYVAYRSRGGAFKFGYGDRPGLAPELRNSVSTNSARRSYLKSGVYLKLENGSITYLRHLKPAHTDIYEIGDALLKPRGTGVPIIISRATERQPCPMCGTVNGSKQSSCSNCELGILKD